MDALVCGTCGSGSRPHLIAKCPGCNVSEHCYCMKNLTYVTPSEWYCAGCQGPNPGQGGQTELQKPWHLSHSNVAHQINARSSNKFGNAKVKFISSEEIALLNRERPPYVKSRFAVRPSKAHPSSPPKHTPNSKCISPSRSDTQVKALKQYAPASHDQTKIDRSHFAKRQRLVHPASPPSMNQPSNKKSISPSRSDMQVQALKRCAAASRDQAKIEDRQNFAMWQSQVRPASPPHVKQLSNMKCASPNRTETQVHARKRSAAASHDQAKIDDINMKQDTRSGGSMPIIHRCTTELVNVIVDSLFEANARKMKIENADKGEINSEIEDEPKEKGALSASDGDTGSKSETESLNQNRDVLLSIDLSMEYTRRPPPAIFWTGCFHVSDAGTNLNLGRFKAHFPSKVSSKVYDIVKMMPSNLELELLPRMNDWPKSFEVSRPVYEDIGLFFFPDEPDGHEKKHSYLFEASSNYVLRTHIDGIKLLIFPSEVLPYDSQWIDGEIYLWGLFVRLKGKSIPRQLGSTTT